MKKFIFFLAWIGILILSIIGMVYSVDPDYINEYAPNAFTTKIIVLNISIIYFCVFFIKLQSKFKKKIDYEVKTPNGSLMVSSDTIKEFVKQLFRESHDIRVIKVNTEKKGSKFKVIMIAEASANKNLVEKITFIQESIKNSIKEAIGIEVDEVELKITKFISE